MSSEQECIRMSTPMDSRSPRRMCSLALSTRRARGPPRHESAPRDGSIKPVAGGARRADPEARAGEGGRVYMWCAGIAGKAVERGLEFPIFNT